MRAPVHEFVARAAASGIALHTLQVRCAGDTIARGEVAPFGIDVPHRFYSVSKTVTGLAVLLLARDGMLRLDDGIMAHFPEMAPVHPWLAQTTIDDILAMTGPHARTTYREGADGWLESYFRVVPTHRPGTLFTYDTSGSFVLAALVERLAGMPLLDQLRVRVPGVFGADARFLTGPGGISHGGSGLIAAPADLQRLAEVLNGRGRYRGRRCVPESVVDQLLQRRSDPTTQTWGAAFRAGYGRQIWLPGEGTWLMFGLGGQLVYGDPAREVTAVVTADTTALAGGDQRLAELMLRACAAESPDARAAGSVADESALVPPADGCADMLMPLKPAHAAVCAIELRGRFARVTGEGGPARIDLTVDAGGGRLGLGGAEVRFSTAAPLVTDLGMGPGVCTAGWTSPGVLDVWLSAAGDDISSVRMRVVVTGDGVVTVQSQGFGPAIDPAYTWRGSYRV